MRIFISHKLRPNDKTVAQIAAHFTVYTTNEIEISYSAGFARGIDWQQKIREELQKADLFILLYEDVFDGWEWCLFEAGTFTAAHPTYPVVCIHRPSIAIPSPLKNYTSVAATKDGILEFLREIFATKWKIRPDLFVHPHLLNSVERSAEDIANLINGGVTLLDDVGVTPSITIELDDHQLKSWSRWQIPDEAVVSGNGAWQAIFNVALDTGAWRWGELVSKLPVRYGWEAMLSDIMWEAHRRSGSEFNSTMVRGLGPSDLYRFTLRRVQRFNNGKLLFNFTIAKASIAHWGRAEAKAQYAFHLVHLTWTFRHNVVHPYRQKFKAHLAASQAKTLQPAGAEMDAVAIRRELERNQVDAVVRDVIDISILQEVLEPYDIDMVAVIQSWIATRDQMYECLKQPVQQLAQIVKLLDEFNQVNRRMLTASAKAYCEYIAKVP